MATDLQPSNFSVVAGLNMWYSILLSVLLVSILAAAPLRVRLLNAKAGSDSV